jgi:hypothetical protein
MHAAAWHAVAAGMPRADLLAANLDAARRFAAIAGFGETEGGTYVARLTLATLAWIAAPLVDEN